MFHCCSRDEIVRASSELARSFAVIGLLRHVKEATPTDMICTYITRTNQSWGLISKVHEVNCAKSNLKYQPCSVGRPIQPRISTALPVTRFRTMRTEQSR